jgi:asparagine synthetase B (glutamine-hydrolysing)
MMKPVRLLGRLDPSFAWDGSRICGRSAFKPGLGLPNDLRGAAAAVEAEPSGAWRLLRDPLGINKLFWAEDPEGTILMAARPYLLVRAGCSFEKIRAIPPGRVIDLLPGGPSVEEHSLIPGSWFAPEELPGVEPEVLAKRIRTTLDRYLSALAAAYPQAEAFVCLSGGLDSTGIATLVREHFRSVVAVSFDLRRPGSKASEDRRVAKRLADDLDLPLLEADVTEDQLFEVLDTVLLEGIDWRDFNVHAGLVNAVLAQVIDGAKTRRSVLVFTGDLANEFLADYEAEQYGDALYYRLPRLSPITLRDNLVRGLDTSHREIGVFAAWNLPVVQPYAAAVDAYLMLRDGFLRSEGRKQRLSRAIFQDLVPDYVFSRPKVRAQVGDPDTGGGVLAACVDRGLDGNRLRQRFAELHGVADPTVLNKFIRAGRYSAAVPTLEGRESRVLLEETKNANS